MVFGEKSLKSNQWYSINILQIFYAIILLTLTKRRWVSGSANYLIAKSFMNVKYDEYRIPV